MKKNKLQYRSIAISLFAAFVLLQTVSCKKYLQVQPRDYMFEEEAFATTKGVEAVLNGIYQNLADSMLYGNVLSLSMTEHMAQYYSGFDNEHGGLYVQFIYTPETQVHFNNIWKKGYKTILGINNFCKKLEDSAYKVLEPAIRRILLGEAYTLRAFIHFDQLRLFGPVYAKNPTAIAIPYVRNATSEIQPLLSANKVLEEIVKDLELASMLLAEDPVRTKGVNKLGKAAVGETVDYMANRHYRMNYFASKALAARVLLYAGKKPEAWQVVNAILLEQESFFGWLTEKEMSGDPVFSKETFFGIDNRKLYDYHRRMFSALLKDGEIYAPKPERLNQIYSINATDLRFKHWFKIGVEGDKQYHVFVKFANTTITETALRYFQPLIRKSELYLIAAETAPDLQLGYSYLNSLRVNKGLTPIDFNINSNYTDLMNAVRAEYQREFIGEGQTFFMFKRNNLIQIPDFLGTGTRVMEDMKYVLPLPPDENYYR